MKTPISSILGYEQDQYELYVFTLYYDWCIEHSYNNTHLQIMIMNLKLYQWFMREYTKRERYFLDMVRHSAKSQNELRNLYYDITATIQFFPKAILYDIVKQTKKATVNTENKTAQYCLN